jgi:tripartite-type tricarboxylate transporter receptor subunit TctC
MSNRRQFIQGASAATLLSAIGQRAFAQAGLPLEQVKIFYGFPAGSSGDIVARRVGEKLAGSAYTKNGAVVDNRPGAGGRIALDVLKPAPADGTHLALTPFSMLALFPHVYSKLAYDASKDFVPVSMAAVMQHGLAVGPMVPASVKNVKDFLAWAKANPKDANYGSPGAGSTPHFIGALMGIQAGVDLKHVPYRGSIPGVTDVVGGQIAAMVTPHGDFIANHKAGKMRILGTSGSKRSPLGARHPYLCRAGLPGAGGGRVVLVLRPGTHTGQRDRRCQRRHQRSRERQGGGGRPRTGRPDRTRLHARGTGPQPEGAVRQVGAAD